MMFSKNTQRMTKTKSDKKTKRALGEGALMEKRKLNSITAYLLSILASIVSRLVWGVVPRMERICAEAELTCFQVRDAAASLERLSHLAFSAGLVRPGIMFAQIRLQLVRIEAGIPLNESGWLCLADLFTER
jgi:hypothetical protein